MLFVSALRKSLPLIAIGFLTPNAFAATTETQAIEAELNAIKDVSATVGTERLKNCDILKATTQSLQSYLATNPSLQRFVDQGQNIHATHCHGAPTEALVPELYSGLATAPSEGVTDEGTTPEADKPIVEKPADDKSELPKEIPATQWEAQPECKKGDRFLHRCQFNHKRGRGLFIYQQPGVYSFPNFLVCALSAGQSSGPFSSGYSITSRCEVSSLDWLGYVNLDPQIRTRTDVRGFLTWSEQSGTMSPIKLPQVMAAQCAAAFPESIFCAPSLIVLPTKNPHHVDVCALHSHRSAFSLFFISISSRSSRWKCQRTDISQVVRDGMLSSSEERCVPNFAADIDPSCDLPYIPRTQNNIHVLSDSL